jgi:hypothetical protein
LGFVIKDMEAHARLFLMKSPSQVIVDPEN